MSLGRWRLELQIYARHGSTAALAFDPVFGVVAAPPLPEALRAAILRRWDEAGRPDNEEALRAVVLATIDAGARHLDPERLDDMKASVRVWRETPGENRQAP